MDTKQVEATPGRLAHSVEEAAHALGIGRSLVFALLKDGKLKSIKIGKRRLIPVVELQAFLDRQSRVD